MAAVFIIVAAHVPAGSGPVTSATPGHLGRGYGTEAIRPALAYAFSTGLHFISLRVLVSKPCCRSGGCLCGG